MADSTEDAVFTRLTEARREFLALVEDVRPDLHRYCARMTGSVIDGEDIVQDTLARAYFELPELKELPAMRSWLFRIAHNRALDVMRRYDRRMGEPLDAASDVTSDDTHDPERAVVRDETVRMALSRFLELAPAQRGTVILKDVLGYSLDEIAGLLDLSVSAVKAALHRGRTRLRELAETTEAPAPRRQTSAALERYASLFNARDWDGVRAMLADDVRLDLVSRWQRSGRDVGTYYTNYDKHHDWHLVPGWLDGREVIAVFREPGDDAPWYLMQLTFDDDRVAAVRDYRYVAYIARDARFERSR